VNMQLGQYIASDLAPSGSQCEGKGCSKLAEQRLTIRDGSGHNVSKLFCCSCSEAFACAIEDTICILATPTKAYYSVIHS
jgi:hypothetical protein